MSTNKRKAFTLIELLVVISIILLLVSTLIPALSAARALATSTVCLGSQKGLIMAWLLYCDDNDDKVVNGNAHPNGWNNPAIPKPWVGPPQADDGTVLRGDVTLAERLNGLRQGALGVYVGNAAELFHCPGDNRTILGTRHGSRPMYQIYRSYSVSQAQSTYPGSDQQCAVKICSSIRMPSGTIIFVEEAYDGGSSSTVGNGNTNFNDEYWNFRGKTRYQWWDPLAMFHKGATTFSYADGHAILHKWIEERTVEYHKDRHGPNNTIFRNTTIDSGQHGDSPDMDWMIQNVGAVYEPTCQ